MSLVLECTLFTLILWLLYGFNSQKLIVPPVFIKAKHFVVPVFQSLQLCVGTSHDARSGRCVFVLWLKVLVLKRFFGLVVKVVH